MWLIPMILDKLARLGARDEEDQVTRISRRVLVLGGALMSCGGLLWGSIALAFGLRLASLIPFGYVVLTAANFLLFSRTRSFRVARVVQVLISLVLPFAFQWVLGGFAASGTVMLWSMVSLLGALAFSQAREAAIWLVLYSALTVASGLADPWLAAEMSFVATAEVRTWLLVLNIVVVSGIVFGLAIYQNVLRTQAIGSLQRANEDNAVLNGQLAKEAVLREGQLEELRGLQTKLQVRSDELAASLEELGRTQGELVEREKHAALGRVVAGVAHEVNTPLGVVYTSVTLALERLEGLKKTMQAEALSRREVLAAVDGTLEALGISASNAERAAKLISDFKRVAVDQTSEAESVIELKSYLDALVLSLSPVLARASVPVRCTGEELTLRTRPGAIAHVVTNLLQNAVMHAFPHPPEEHPRQVHVRCSADATHAVIEVEDNGVGMTAEVVRHVFEPFFTTKRGAGGSGLGMHIVSQQVHGALKGTIAIDTSPGWGSRIRLRFPLLPPAEPDSSHTVDAGFVI